MSIIKTILKKIYDSVFYKVINVEKSINNIISNGGGIPLSPAYKQNNIREYAQYYNADIFIETGTYLGDTTASLENYFRRLFTIELSKELYDKAINRFKGSDKVQCFNGDSKIILNSILDNIDGIPLFWLDAHYSAGFTARGEEDTPIIGELKVIFEKINKGIILIDDARCFGTDPAYPSKFKIKCIVKKHFPCADIEVYDDIIRIVYGFN